MQLTTGQISVNTPRPMRTVGARMGEFPIDCGASSGGLGLVLRLVLRLRAVSTSFAIKMTCPPNF